MAPHFLQLNSDKIQVVTIDPDHVADQIHQSPLTPNIKPSSRNLGVIFQPAHDI